MTLADYLTTPEQPAPNCALFVARYLELARISDLIKRLDPVEVEATIQSGEALALARRIFAAEGFRVVERPAPGDPVCARTSAGETMGLWTGRFTATVCDRGAIVGRWPLLAAWSL